MYDESTIQVLKGLEGVRKRPGMYVRGVDQLIWDAVDSALAVDATYVRIVIDGDAITIEDDGDSIPVVPMPTDPEHTVLEMWLTVLHAGDCRTRRQIYTSMHGMGLCIVNALSERCEVDAWWDGRHFQLGFARGVTVSRLRELGATDRRGMRVTFTPDFSILARAAWDREAIAARLRELAALHPRVTFILDHDAVRCPDGVVDHARYLADTRVAPVRHAIARDHIAVDVALAWREHGAPILASFANTRALRIAGVDDGLWRAFADAEPARLAGVHRAAFRELIEVGLVAVVAVDYSGARWNYHTSTLTSPEVAPVVAEAVAAAVSSDRALCERLRARLP